MYEVLEMILLKGSLSVGHRQSRTDVREKNRWQHVPLCFRERHLFLVFFHKASVLLPYSNLKNFCPVLNKWISMVIQYKATTIYIKIL